MKPTLGHRDPPNVMESKSPSWPSWYHSFPRSPSSHAAHPCHLSYNCSIVNRFFLPLLLTSNNVFSSPLHNIHCHSSVTIGPSCCSRMVTVLRSTW
ncbi:hypothetical protein BJV78DRAFT_1233084 [Lactifluus subvellereus]|nr:hypothetical protein BJV78DRAFT_1233084 [Lactifluus subvellereus]